jgi:hypothetical protein
MRHYNLAVLSSLAGWILVLPVSISGCGSTTPVACGGQCAPPYELQVDFHSGTAHAAAQKLLTSCADHNPVVVRIGTPRDIGRGVNRAIIYTQAFGNTPRTAGLLTCLRHSGLVATVGWPD